MLGLGRHTVQGVGREAFCGGEAGEEVSNDRNSAQLNALAALSIEDLVPRCARTRRHILFLRKLRERYGNSSTPCSRREFVRQVYRKVHGRVYSEAYTGRCASLEAVPDGWYR